MSIFSCGAVSGRCFFQGSSRPAGKDSRIGISYFALEVQGLLMILKRQGSKASSSA
jgi:hypothetical protein